jgi:D-alanine-D-alanine ligase
MMRIGITYDLRDLYMGQGLTEEETAEFDDGDTIDAIAQALLRLGYEPDPIGTIRQLVDRLARGDRWVAVFNIAEGVRGFGREAQVPAILEAYDIPYTFSDPLTLSLTLHKAMAKRVLRDLNIPTPEFCVIEDESEIPATSLPFPLFVKPVAEGTGKGIQGHSRVSTPEALQTLCRDLLRRHAQPILVERYLPGREFTVGVLGTEKKARPMGVLEVRLRGRAEPFAYTYINKERCEDLVDYSLADDATARWAADIALAAWRGLGCRDAGRVDIRLDAAGVPNVMEINPLAGLHPVHSDLPILATMTGMTYDTLIDTIITSTLVRYDLVEGRKRYDGTNRHSLQRPATQGNPLLGIV